MAAETHPKEITIDRNAGVMQVRWHDGHPSDYSLRWLRANCPCATCREERREAVINTDPLKLTTTPPPSFEIAGAEFVGNYAIRFTWQDGHGAGIYAFNILRQCCPCAACNPDGPPPFVPD
jgi:DUF971 family protein